ncbi:MAG: hypothetical protein E7493_01975 [Ruminococcus albus]|nr:hypothetical protein [Ruminococcus albus]
MRTVIPNCSWKLALKPTPQDAHCRLSFTLRKCPLKRGRWISITRNLAARKYSTEYDGCVCVDPFGKLISPNTVTQDFHEVIKKHDMKMLRFHDLRHSCASLLLANDIPMKAIQEWLGHATFNITANLHSHLEYHAKVTSAETIAKVLSGKKEDAPTDTKETAPEEAPKKSNSRKKKNESAQDKSQPAAV